MDSCRGGFNQSNLSNLGEVLNSELKEAARADTKGLLRYILTIEPIKAQSIWGYHFNSTSDFLKITVAIPALVATARRILEKGINIPNSGYKQFVTYESNLPFVLRYMVDNNIKGGSW
jgi:DNA polymerase delta subunit 1